MKDLKNIKAERPAWQKFVFKVVLVALAVGVVGFIEWCAR